VRIGRSIESAAENRNVRVLIFLKLILDSLPKKLDERSIWSGTGREPIAPPLVKVVASGQPLVIHELKDAAVTQINTLGVVEVDRQSGHTGLQGGTPQRFFRVHRGPRVGSIIAAEQSTSAHPNEQTPRLCWVDE